MSRSSPPPALSERRRGRSWRQPLRAAGRALALVALVAVAAPTPAAVMKPASVEDLARASDAVVRGRITGVSSRWIGTRIWTYVDLETTAVWRGSAPGRASVVTPGGVVGHIGQRVDGAAAFDRGEEVVVFLERAAAGTFRVTGNVQGKFSVQGGQARPDLAHTAFVAAKLREGERPVAAMDVKELEDRVRAAR